MNFEESINQRRANYNIMSKAELTNRRAKAWFQTPPYYMRDLKSWTTGKEDEADDRSGERELHLDI